MTRFARAGKCEGRGANGLPTTPASGEDRLGREGDAFETLVEGRRYFTGQPYAAHAISLLRAAHESSLRLAGARGLSSLAFPAISTGAYGFPLERAAKIALATAAADWSPVGRVRFVLFTEEAHAVYAAEFARMSAGA